MDKLYSTSRNQGYFYCLKYPYISLTSSWILLSALLIFLKRNTISSMLTRSYVTICKFLKSPKPSDSISSPVWLTFIDRNSLVICIKEVFPQRRGRVNKNLVEGLSKIDFKADDLSMNKELFTRYLKESMLIFRV